MIRVPRTHWASAAAISVAGLCLALGIYFIVYQGWQEEYYKGRNFRVLGTVGLQLTEQVEAFRQVLVTYSPSAEEMEAAYREIADRPWYVDRLAMVQAERTCARRDLKSAQAIERGLAGDPPNRLRAQQLVSRAEWNLDRVEQQEKVLTTRTRTIFDANQRVLKHRLDSLQRVAGFEELEIKIVSDSTRNSSKQATAAAKQPEECDDKAKVDLVGGKLTGSIGPCTNSRSCWRARPGLEASVPFAGLVDFTPALKIFDEVLIADEEGRVLDRKGDIQSGVHDLSSLVAQLRREKPAAAPKKARADKSGDGTNAATSNGNDSGRALRLPAAATLDERIPIGGVDYSVFVLPIEPPFHESKQPWYVIGIVSESSFRTQVASVPVPVLNTAVLALVLCGLAWPFLKVRFGGGDEEVRSGTAFYIALCLVAGVGVLVFTLMTVFAATSRREQRDRTLMVISTDLRTAFDSEVVRMREALDAEAKRIEPSRWVSRSSLADKWFDFDASSGVHVSRQNKLEEQKQPEAPKSDCPELRSVIARIRADKDKKDAERLARENEVRKKQPAEADGRPTRPLRLPPFEVVFGLDADGIQRSEMRSHRQDEASACFSAVDRDYFKRIRDGAGWKAATSDSNASTFFIERIRARGRGSLNYVLSAPHPDRSSASIVKVVALIGNLRSFADAVLPPGFGFAVVENETGKTIHHSDNDVWSLVENFFEETDQDPLLRAAIRLHRGEWVTAKYYGRSHRFYTAPLRDTEWSLVVFHREALAQAAQFELLAVSAGLLLVYIGMVGVVIWIAAWWFPASRGWSWIWPNPVRSAAYGRLIPGLFFVLGTGTALAGMNGYLVPVVVLLQVAAVVACVAYALSSPSLECRDRTRARRRWVVALVFLACVLRAFAGEPPSSASDLWSPLKVWILALALLCVLALRSPRGRPARSREPMRRWRTAYLATVVLLLGIVAGLPSVAIFRDALRFESDRFSIFKAMRVAEGVHARESALHAELTRIDPHVSRLFEARWRQMPLPRLCCSPSRDTAYDCDGDDVWSLSETAVHCERLIPPRVWTRHAQNELLQPSFSAWLAMRIPAVDRDFGAARFAQELQSADDRWQIGSVANLSYRRTSVWPGVAVRAGAQTLPLRLHEANYCPGEVSRGRNSFDLSFGGIVRETVAPGPCDGGDLPDHSGRLAILLSCLLVTPVITATCRRLYGLGQPTPPAQTPTTLAAMPWLDKRRLVLGASVAEFDAIATTVDTAARKDIPYVIPVDLRRPDEPASSLSTLHAVLRIAGRPTLVIVGPLDYVLIEPDRRLKLLEFMEELHRCSVSVCAISEISPLTSVLLPGPASGVRQSGAWHAEIKAKDAPSGSAATSGDAQREEDAQRAAERGRWTGVLERLEVVEWVPPPRPDWRDLSDPKDALLERECGWRAELRVMHEQLDARLNALVPNAATPHPSEDQLLESIVIAAEPSYRRIWETCTREERLALLHIAGGSYMNTLNTEVLRSLERRRLLVRDPVLRIRSRAFARYAGRAEDAERLKHWERSAHQSNWVALRIPILFLVGGLALFLSYSGPDFATSGLTVVPALLSALPPLLGFLNSLRSTARGTPASGS